VKPDSKSANLPGQKSTSSPTSTEDGKESKNSEAESMREELKGVLKELDELQAAEEGN